MVRFRVWTKWQALLLVIAIVAVSVTVTWCAVQSALPASEKAASAEDGQAVFAANGDYRAALQPTLFWEAASTPSPGDGADVSASEASSTTADATAPSDHAAHDADPANASSDAATPSPSETSAEATPVDAGGSSVQAAATDRGLRVEVIRTSPVPAQAAGKRILIYHTHTWEAYRQVETAPYVETEKWRTKDPSANVVAVGAALTASLEAMGCTVVHDETAFEPPDLSTSYQRSLTMLEKRVRLGEQFDLYIDLHRDAFSADAKVTQTVSVGGEAAARFMVLVGKGTGQGYDVKPDWQANLTIAEQITDSLNAQAENLCREVKVKTGRFNQHIAPCCVLIECGNNRNTLDEVLIGIPYLAQAIMDSLATLQ